MRRDLSQLPSGRAGAAEAEIAKSDAKRRLHQIGPRAAIEDGRAVGLGVIGSGEVDRRLPPAGTERSRPGRRADQDDRHPERRRRPQRSAGIGNVVNEYSAASHGPIIATARSRGTSAASWIEWNHR